MSIICLKTFRDTRLIQELVRGGPVDRPATEECTPEWRYSEVRERLRARFGDSIPKHFERTLSKPQPQPYMHGDVHNVRYRKKTVLFNRPMPIPSEVTAASCRKRGDTYLLGSRCLDGIDEPFPWMDHKYQVTLHFLRSLPDGTKLEIQTRSDLVAHDDYIAELVRLNVDVILLCPAWMDDNAQRYLEPGAPSKCRRIKACEKLRESGIRASMNYHNVPGQPKAVES